MNIDLKNFNPTYYEAYNLLKECKEVLKIYNLRSVVGLDVNGSDYNKLLTLTSVLEYAIKVSKATIKISEFDNMTFNAIETQLHNAYCEADRLRSMIDKVIKIVDDNIDTDEEIPDVFTAYENKLDEIRDIKNKLNHIESHYRVDVSQG